MEDLNELWIENILILKYYDRIEEGLLLTRNKYIVYVKTVTIDDLYENLYEYEIINIKSSYSDFLKLKTSFQSESIMRQVSNSVSDLVDTLIEDIGAYPVTKVKMEPIAIGKNILIPI